MLYNKRLCVLMMSIAFFTASCSIDTGGEVGASQELTPIIEKQDLFEQKLNQIVKKLDNLQIAIGKIQPGPPAANNNKQQQNKRKPSDPNYVHNIPQGDSYFIGNANAKVTITEFYDFQ